MSASAAFALADRIRSNFDDRDQIARTLAEAITEASDAARANVVTRDDLKSLATKDELRAEVAGVRSEIAGVRTEVATVRNWVLAGVIATLLGTATLVGAGVAYLARSGMSVTFGH